MMDPEDVEHIGDTVQRKAAARARTLTIDSANDKSGDGDEDIESLHRSRRLAALVHWVQGLRVPGTKSSISPHGRPFLSGLDKVIFGTLAASEAVKVCGVKPPQYLFYMISGAVCDVLQFFIDYAIHFYLHDSSVCWALSFMLSITARHSSHRYLVFGAYVGGYWNSLGRMYAGYSVIIVVSTLFNMFMTRVAKFPHYVAWICTLLWTGIVNYFILKKLWSFGGASRRKEFSSKTSNLTDANMEILDGSSNSPKPNSPRRKPVDHR